MFVPRPPTRDPSPEVRAVLARLDELDALAATYGRLRAAVNPTHGTDVVEALHQREIDALVSRWSRDTFDLLVSAGYSAYEFRRLLATSVLPDPAHMHYLAAARRRSVSATLNEPDVTTDPSTSQT